MYIGIDVHKDTYSLCCFDFHKNELSDEMTIKATTKAVIKYLEAMRNIFIYCCCRPRKEIRNSGISATKSILSDRANACKIFCFKFLNYYLKNAQNGKILLGGIMLLRESLEEIDDFRVKRCRKFEFGPPSADTILRVFRNVNADKIEKV